MWRKKFRKGKLQSALTAILLAACALLITSSISIITSLDKPYQDLIEETHPADLKVYPMRNQQSMSKDWISEMEKMDSVQKCIAIHRHYVNGTLTRNDKELEGFFSMVQFEEEVNRNVRVIEGDYETPKDDECYISSVMANKFDVQMGDILSFYQGDEQYSYKVAAIFVDGYSLNQAFQLEIFVNKIPEAFEDQPYYVAFARKGADGDSIIDEYLNAQDGILDGSFTTAQMVIDNASITEKIMGGILLILSIIIFLVCTVMIRYMLRNLLLKDRNSIAVYKAIGYRNSDLKGIYLTYYLILSLTSSGVGTMCSPLVSNIFIRSSFKNLGEKASASTFLPAVGCLIVMNLIVYVQVIRELKSIRNMRPVEILTGTEQSKSGKKTKKAASKVLSFSPMGMALRMMRRDKKNTIIIVFTCVMSVFMVNIALACIGNIDTMKEENYYWLGFDKSDVFVENSGDFQQFQNLCNRLLQDSDVDKVIYSNLDSLSICIPWMDSSVSVMVYDTFEDITVPVTAGRNPKHADEIVIGNLLAKQMDKGIGDYIDVYLNQDTKVSMLIVGTYQSFYNLGKGTKMLKSTYEEHGIDVPVMEASVYVKDGVNPQSIVDRYQKDYAQIDIRQNRFSNILDMVCDPQRMALMPFASMVMLIGGLNVIYIVHMKNVSSRKTYSIYKSIGYSARHLLKMNICYIGTIALLSIFITVPLFVVLFPKMMIVSMSMFGFMEYPVHYEWNLMILGNLSVLALFLLSSVVSSGNLFKNHIAELIQE